MSPTREYLRPSSTGAKWLLSILSCKFLRSKMLLRPSKSLKFWNKQTSLNQTVMTSGLTSVTRTSRLTLFRSRASLISSTTCKVGSTQTQSLTSQSCSADLRSLETIILLVAPTFLTFLSQVAMSTAVTPLRMRPTSCVLCGLSAALRFKMFWVCVQPYHQAVWALASLRSDLLNGALSTSSSSFPTLERSLSSGGTKI